VKVIENHGKEVEPKVSKDDWPEPARFDVIHGKNEEHKSVSDCIRDPLVQVI
jgi:hypothetical protein